MIHALHGTVGSFKDWSFLERALEPSGRTLITHDLWRYCQNDGVGLWQFASLFNQSVATESKDEPQDLIAYSMGGRLALHALLENQSLWRSAVIVSAHTGLEASKRSERLKSDQRWAELAADEDSSWLTFLKKWNSQGVLRSTPQSPELEWHDRELLAPQRSEVATSFRNWSLGRQDDLLARLPEVHTPVLWVVGERDQKFRALAEDAAAALPNAELLIIPDAGHRVPWEAPDAFHSAVLQWLEAQQ